MCYRLGYPFYTYIGPNQKATVDASTFCADASAGFQRFVGDSGGLSAIYEHRPPARGAEAVGLRGLEICGATKCRRWGLGEPQEAVRN